jgi:ribosome-associated protein
MIEVTRQLLIPDSELSFQFITAPGPGGQNVNKVATAVQLRFNIVHSTSLPEAVRARLLMQQGSKVSKQGDIVIKASQYRTQERNKQDAIDRLIAIIKKATEIPKARRKTKPTRASVQRRLDKKKRESAKKTSRRFGPVTD